MPKHLLLLTQVYVPDPASVGQHMADAAEAMVERGWKVTVFTANRGYDNPGQRFPSREMLNGVEVRRLPASSFGKANIAQRLVGQLSFCVQAFFRGLFLKSLDAVLVTTSPPMGSVVGWAIKLFRRVRLIFWVMDINPDQAVRLQKLKSDAWLVRFFDWFNSRILKSADRIVALDRFMAETLQRKVADRHLRIDVFPPWPMQGVLEPVSHEANPFRDAHGLDGKFVVMYSGNHSLAHPLDTALEASRLLRDDSRVLFLFVGGGNGKEMVDHFIAEEKPPNVRSLPYQPLNEIKFSLSAADLHIVSMGQEMVSIVHPCKFYGAMALGRPFLLIGPEECHVTDVLKEVHCGWRVGHGEAREMAVLIRELSNAPLEQVAIPGKNGQKAVARMYGKDLLCKKLCEVISDETTPQPQEIHYEN